MRVVHLSDLHLSRYGETGTWTQRGDLDGGWKPVHSWQRWVIEGRCDKKDRPEKLRLVDPSGVIHRLRSWPKKKDDRAIGTLLVAMERHLTSAERLIHDRPCAEDLAAMLRVDPDNTNLLFLRLLDDIKDLSPDLLLLTGDVTDNGLGYQMVQHYFAPWIKRRRLLVIPGNHDTYDMLPRKGRRARTKAKWERYRKFLTATGISAERCGAWLHHVEDIAVVGLNSCDPPLTPLSASGEVSADQLRWLEQLRQKPSFVGARLRLCLVHHHLLRMPFELGRRTPIEVGMRLRNAPRVMQATQNADINMILNGHRHHGYVVQLPGHATVISSPSSTLGCKSTNLKYVWTIDMASEHPYPMLHQLNGLQG